MTYSPGLLITQLQKAPFTWALGRCHWWVILGHQQMSRATGTEPCPMVRTTYSSASTGPGHRAIRVLSTLCCPGLFPRTTPAEPPCRKGFNVFASTCKHMATCLAFGTRSKTVWGYLK